MTYNSLEEYANSVLSEFKAEHVDTEYSLKSKGLVDLINNISKGIISEFPYTLHQYFKSKVHISGVVSINIFGFISSEKSTGYSVIAVSTGFMTFLNKIIKFDLALNDPSLITYCNRYPVDEIDQNKIMMMRKDLITQYSKNDARGPIVLIKGNEARGIQLYTQEAFIVAHEISHFLDKYVFDGFITKLMFKFTSNPIKNDCHASELAADAFAVYLLRRSGYLNYLSNESNSIDPKVETSILCSSICHFFDYLNLVDNDESETHPCPDARIENVLWWNFGEDITQAYFKWRKGGEYPLWNKLPLSDTGINLFRELLNQTNNIK